MSLAALLLALAVPAATPTAVPQSTGQGGLSSYAGSVKVDRSKADALFRQDTVPAATPGPGGSPYAPHVAPQGSRVGEETWRAKAASLKAELEQARIEKGQIERTISARSGSPTSAGQRDLLLSRHQERINRLQAALDALAERCRTNPGCHPGWVR